MSDEDFDEDALRAAALKSMAMKKPGRRTPEPRFTPLPRPDFNPSLVQGIRPIPSRVPSNNFGHLNTAMNNHFRPHHQSNHFNNHPFNFRNPNSYHGNYNGNINNYHHSLNQMIPPQQFNRHELHHPIFNYPVRPLIGGGGFHPLPMYQNQQQQQPHAPFHPQKKQLQEGNRCQSNSQQNSLVPKHKKIHTESNKKKDEEWKGSKKNESDRNESNDSRRLPERFSRIERSDSESDEDDRLDQFIDEDDKSRDSFTTTDVTNYTLVPNSSKTESEDLMLVPNSCKAGSEDLVLCENTDYDDLLGEEPKDVLLSSQESEAKDEESQHRYLDHESPCSEQENSQLEISPQVKGSDRESSEVKGSDRESSSQPKRSDCESSPRIKGSCLESSPQVKGSDCESSSQVKGSNREASSGRDASPVRPQSKRVVIVAQDTPETSSSVEVGSRQKSPTRKVDVSEKRVSSVPAEPVMSGRIRLKVNGDMDAAERRRLKFGSVDEESASGNKSQDRREVANGRGRNEVVSERGRNEVASERGRKDEKRKPRVPSCSEMEEECPCSEEEDFTSNRKKLRSFVVLKK